MVEGRTRIDIRAKHMNCKAVASNSYKKTAIMNTQVSLILVFSCLTLAMGDDDCFRPDSLRVKEDYCWTTEVEIVDRVVQTSRSVLNFAKKKLGIGVEEEVEIKKCGYYQCILRQLHMLDTNNYPDYANILKWSERHVVYFQAIALKKRLDECNDALTNSTMKELFFYGDLVDNQKQSVDSPEGQQNPCDIAGEFIKCLSLQKECPVFQYP